MTLRDQVLLASRQADQEMPYRLHRNRGADCFQHITRVLEILKGQGLQAAYIGKTSGEGQYHPPGFPRIVGSYTITGVSHDAIWVEGKQFDLIGGGHDGPDPLGQPATPTANEIPAQFHRANNPAVPHPLDGTVSPPAPTPQPAAPYIPSYAELGDDAFFRAAIGVPLQADMLQVDQQLNDGSSVWFSRTLYEIITESVKAGRMVDVQPIVRKYRNQWRAILGLPPV